MTVIAFTFFLSIFVPFSLQILQTFSLQQNNSFINFILLAHSDPFHFKLLKLLFLSTDVLHMPVPMSLRGIHVNLIDSFCKG